jgi:hypothetical protein
MSRGTIDIVLYEIDQTAQTIEDFTTDPDGFLAGFDLSDVERVAFVDWDYGTLYALGAHPFLLFQVARSLAVHNGMSMPDLLRQYRETVTPLGTPDYIT